MPMLQHQARLGLNPALDTTAGPIQLVIDRVKGRHRVYGHDTIAILWA